MGRFDDTVAIVTGGVSGIGAAISRRLLDEGGKVVIADIAEDAIGTVEQDFGANAMGVRTDATSESDMEALFAAAIEKFGDLDLVFNVAGGAKQGRVVDMDLETWRANIALNLDSAFLGTKLGAKHFLETGKQGAIVNVSSLNSQVPMHFGAGYASGKAGAVMLTRNAAIELGGDGIRVNSVSPGLVATPMTAGLLGIPGLEEAYMERIPAGRAAEPEEIAAVALFLASSDASYINGEDIVVDGSWKNTGYPDLRPFLS
ncbi:MAG: SDR family oxidoreductase [Actinomycetia bacterium]|nr:SDR family oxidoreductase [Actinomycetes bacterium]